ncbi:hypothetical protein [Inhella gelatinilytica]|uniref:Uncharacterized protein n=1 Tax=Inhella gelatinilytica TaxID=2795030 RepID=A0A931IUN1_9BURK|nr:hypothetical protein [Inhella gelatinilytica]MBH9552474.1 hypothetical protein [Inhella gelatinilytica]
MGRWKSSRLSSPLVLTDKGEWEILSDEGKALQFGLWRLEGAHLVWTVRAPNGGLTHDPTPILIAEPERFAVRERDGSVTTFVRLKDPA